MTHNVLLVGGGGREHALARAISRSPNLGALWITHPGNPGLAALAGDRVMPIKLDRREKTRILHWLDKQRIDLVVFGPEDPLAEGFADMMRAGDRPVFGPGAEGAQLEADKAWAKQLMRGAAIPTAEARSFRDAENARSYVASREEPPVIKAAGLAKGKGVIVPATTEEAVEAVDRIMVQREFGQAGDVLIAEERLAGPEVSVFALTDGRTIAILEACQDHKRLGDGDTGPNTGGMGAFCPSPLIDGPLMSRVEREILVPTVDALKREGIDYRGVLYAGLMLTHAGPKVLEFNVRFGDPECQALMPRLDGDLLEILHACAARRLSEIDFGWRSGATCCVVLASHGYPAGPRKGDEIIGIEEAERVEGVTVYHAGTARDAQGRLVTAGGRVLNVVATGTDLSEARDRAYQAADLIEFDGKVMRRDIGASAVSPAAR
jgi:phosphoribosylamine--glycine ligase